MAIFHVVNNEKIKRQPHVVRIFPHEASCLGLVRALAVEIHEEYFEAIRYINMNMLKAHKKQLRLSGGSLAA